MCDSAKAYCSAAGWPYRAAGKSEGAARPGPCGRPLFVRAEKGGGHENPIFTSLVQTLLPVRDCDRQSVCSRRVFVD